MTTTTIAANDKYVTTWDDFIGQTRAVAQLKTACSAARQRNEPLPHLLLASGLHGIGKTNLAVLVAREMGVQMHETTGKVDSNAARILLSGMDDHEILFIDELHLLVDGSRARAEWLLHLLADGVLLGPRGPEPQPNITVIAATTDVGRLQQTVTSRFELRPNLTAYSDEEAARIVNRHIAKILPHNAPLLPPDDVRAVARAASNNPRMIRKILLALRDLWQVHGRYDLPTAFEWVSVLPDGLTLLAQTYLRVLFHEYDGQAGETAMKTRLHEPGGLATTERLLADKGLLAFTRSGRTLTAAGIRRAKQKNN